MESQTISQVSKQFHISTRTLRYYEQIGLISPVKKEGFAYRMYDADTIMRIRQIIVLRKLRIPLKQIVEILQDDSVQTALQILEKNLSEIEDELSALSVIGNIIKILMDKLKENHSRFSLPDDDGLLEIIDSLTISKINFKEVKTMKDLNRASAELNKLTDKDVRIVYLPPSTVAAYQYVGDNPEMHCHEVMNQFVSETGLAQIKPDIRNYGFNAPNPVDETGYHGYEVWVTIPDDMEVPAPIVKKHFEGGMYAAHMIPFGAFEEWEWLAQWVRSSDKYEYVGTENTDNMCGWLEEHLNYIYHVQNRNAETPVLQLDLLIPVKEAKNGN